MDGGCGQDRQGGTHAGLEPIQSVGDEDMDCYTNPKQGSTPQPKPAQFARTGHARREHANLQKHRRNTACIGEVIKHEVHMQYSREADHHRTRFETNRRIDSYSQILSSGIG